jgi:DNA-directed RNA polymerase subunit RPC12/RpoP
MRATPTRAFEAGTLAGAGTFRCQECGFAVALRELDEVPRCPHCGSQGFTRASIFREQTTSEPWSPHAAERPEWLARARDGLDPAGQYLAYRVGGGERARIAPLVEEWTRIGRSPSAQIRFNDPTVSRRHALVHSEASGARVLDDRSLNGVLVNGDRVEASELQDGDEITIGRFHLYFVRPAGRTPSHPAPEARSAAG